MRQKLGAAAIVTAIGAVALAVLFAPASVRPPAADPVALSIARPAATRPIAAAMAAPGVPVARRPGSRRHLPPPRTPVPVTADVGLPAGLPREAPERTTPIEATPITTVGGTSPLAPGVQPARLTTPPHGSGAMTTAGKAIGKALGTAGRSVATAFQRVF